MANSMTNNHDNNSRLVKLVEKILDDGWGISDEAYDALLDFLKDYYCTRPLPSRLQKMIDCIEGTDGRVYIDEEWDA